MRPRQELRDLPPLIYLRTAFIGQSSIQDEEPPSRYFWYDMRNSQAAQDHCQRLTALSEATYTVVVGLQRQLPRANQKPDSQGGQG